MVRHSPLRAVPDQPRRVVLYVRVSALMGRGGDDFHSPETQVSAMRRATTGMREVDVVEDIDVSGRTFSREGLDKIRAMVEARQVDAIAVYDWTRFGRNVKEALTFLEWLDNHGVAVIAGGEQTDRTTPEGEFTVGMLLHVAQLHSRIIGRYWSGVIATRASDGKAHGPTPPYGYRRGDDGPEPDPMHGPIVARAFAAYATGAQVADIMRRIAAERGRPINRPTVKRMFYNPFYAGKVRLHGEVFDGRHVPLVDPDVWERAQTRLRRDATTPARRLSPAYSLSGLVFCDECERPMVATIVRKIRRLECQAQARETTGCLGAGTPPVGEIETAVLAQFLAYIETLQRDQAATAKRAARSAKASADAEGVEKSLADVRAGMVRTHRAWRSGTTPDWLYEQDMAEMRAQEETLRGRLEELRSPQAVTSVREQTSLARRLVESWPVMPPAERRHLLGLAVRRVWVRRAEYYREPVHLRTRIDPW